MLKAKNRQRVTETASGLPLREPIRIDLDRTLLQLESSGKVKRLQVKPENSRFLDWLPGKELIITWKDKQNTLIYSGIFFR